MKKLTVLIMLCTAYSLLAMDGNNDDSDQPQKFLMPLPMLPDIDNRLETNLVPNQQIKTLDKQLQALIAQWDQLKLTSPSQNDLDDFNMQIINYINQPKIQENGTGFIKQAERLQKAVLAKKAQNNNASSCKEEDQKSSQKRKRDGDDEGRESKAKRRLIIPESAKVSASTAETY